MFYEWGFDLAVAVGGVISLFSAAPGIERDGAVLRHQTRLPDGPVEEEEAESASAGAAAVGAAGGCWAASAAPLPAPLVVVVWEGLTPSDVIGCAVCMCIAAGWVRTPVHNLDSVASIRPSSLDFSAMCASCVSEGARARK